jgi:peptidoglycan lytic transglycosylase
MVVRLSAALCGVAMIFALSVAMAKTSSTHAEKSSSKKSANGKSAHEKSAKAAPLPPAKPALDANGAVANPLARHVFVSRRAPFLCSPRPLTFVERFQPAQLIISTAIIKETDAEELGIGIIGTASMYNPYRPGYKEGGIETASGELYDPAAWTAAIQTDLRGDFGGVQYGRDYKPAYALVESGDKRIVVKINDVGPLTPGRVIDLNQQAMHYFDPSLARGLVSDIQVTPLPGEGWVPGPVERDLQVLSAKSADARYQ